MSPRTVRTNGASRSRRTPACVMRPGPPRDRGWRRRPADVAEDVDRSSVARAQASLDRQRRRRAGGLAHGHALGHRADRGMGIVRGGEAAAGDEQVLDAVADEQRPVRDAHRLPVGQVLPARVGAAVGGPRSARRTGRSGRRTAARPGRRRASAGSRRRRGASRARRAACRSRPGWPPRSRARGRRRNRAYSRAWRRPAISASVRNPGSVALIVRPSGACGRRRGGS